MYRLSFNKIARLWFKVLLFEALAIIKTDPWHRGLGLGFRVEQGIRDLQV